MSNAQFDSYIQQISLPQEDSHKGQNGKVLVIGGSTLFHAASQWSLLVVSRIVDMVFYSSVPSNNAIVQEDKKQFSNGIVVERTALEDYINEADVILIGPGMTREKLVDEKWTQQLLSGCRWSIETEKSSPPIRIRKRTGTTTLTSDTLDKLKTKIDWEKDTYAITNYLIAKYPEKKWVIDAGALQMVEPALINQHMIITPHEKELETLFSNLGRWVNQDDNGEDVLVGKTRYIGGYKQYFDGLHFLAENNDEIDKEFQKENRQDVIEMSKQLENATVLLKGKVDKVIDSHHVELIHGGNPGMTKGGTGDVLAGLIAGLYAWTNNPFAAAVVGSLVNKRAGDDLYATTGTFFNSTDLANQIPKTLKSVFHR